MSGLRRDINGCGLLMLLLSMHVELMLCNVLVAASDMARVIGVYRSSEDHRMDDDKGTAGDAG